MRRRPAPSFWFTLWLLLACASPCLAAIDVTGASQVEISNRLEWCKTTPDVAVERIVAGGCKFKPVKGIDLSPGVSADAFWLRFTLSNTGTEHMHLWLQTGHPRLQNISLFHLESGNNWRRTDTGLNVPVAKRPIKEAHPLLPIELEPGEQRAYLIRVSSETSIHLNSIIWEPVSYAHAQHGKELFQMVAIGGLMLAIVFTLMVFYRTREKTYLFLGATLLSEIFLDLGYTGLLQVYIWPASEPYPLAIQALAVGLTLGFFGQFVREFLGVKGMQGGLNRLLLVAMIILTLSTAWGALVSYGDAIRILPLAGIAILLASSGLFYQSWKTGYRPAAYLMLSFCVLLLMLIYRAVMVYGLLPYSFIQSLGFSWYFLLITPLILAGTLKRSEEFQAGMMRSRAEAEARVTFMAQMSHEFRSPLNTILGYAELLARGIKSTSTQPAEEIRRSGRDLLSMIDEILEHSRGEAGLLRLELAPADWPGFITALKQSATMMAQSHDNRFDLIEKGPMPPALRMDERRLRQVLDNLLTNANRYTRHGTITLTCHAEPVNARICRLNFSVSDTGSGIAPDELEKIFQPFTRGTAGLSSGIDGTGMGLAIVRQLVEIMGGHISVESAPGRGSVFSFSIECELAEPNAPAFGHARSRPPKACRILVVDDDMRNRNLLKLILSDSGFDVILSESAQAARHHLGKPVDLVITDQFMADGDGWSLLQEWSDHDVPVILLSAAPPLRPQNLPANYQFRLSLLKPFDADMLIASIGQVLGIDYRAKPRPASKTPDEHPLPPHAMLIPLQAMIAAGAVTEIIDWLAKFGQDHPEYRAFCEAATTACRELDFKTLQNWVSGPDAR